MCRSILAAALAALAGLSVAAASASAQQTRDTYGQPVLGAEPPEAASPAGAAYIPGVGFRFVTPGGARVLGYRAYAPRVYGYYADRESMRYRAYRGDRRCRGDWWRDGRRCERWW